MSGRDPYPDDQAGQDELVTPLAAWLWVLAVTFGWVILLANLAQAIR